VQEDLSLIITIHVPEKKGAERLVMDETTFTVSRQNTEPHGVGCMVILVMSASGAHAVGMFMMKAYRGQF
jgi:hypothetical protein